MVRQSINAKRRLKVQCFVLVVGAVLTCALSLFSFVYGLSTNISILVDEEVKQVSTFKRTVQEALLESEILLGEYDKVNLPLDQALTDNSQIVVTRGKNIILVDVNTPREVVTSATTVGELLAENSISIGELDSVDCNSDDILYDNMKISVTRNSEIYIVSNEVEPRLEKQRTTLNLASGQMRVVNEGQDGIREVVYKVSYQNGKEVAKEVMSEKVIQTPVARVVEYGAMGTSLALAGSSSASRSGNDIPYKAVYTMKATAYDDSVESNGNASKKTANGTPLARGVVAVDPKVIPLGTRLYIETEDGSYVYGNAIAADTGGAIKGNRIDLFMESTGECYAFGVRNVKVYVLE